MHLHLWPTFSSQRRPTFVEKSAIPSWAEKHDVVVVNMMPNSLPTHVASGKQNPAFIFQSEDISWCVWQVENESPWCKTSIASFQLLRQPRKSPVSPQTHPLHPTPAASRTPIAASINFKLDELGPVEAETSNELTEWLDPGSPRAPSASSPQPATLVNALNAGGFVAEKKKNFH
jgi:hypothetical protein